MKKKATLAIVAAVAAATLTDSRPDLFIRNTQSRPANPRGQNQKKWPMDAHACKKAPPKRGARIYRRKA